MQNYVALLRGINVSGKHKILMKDLKEIFQDLGLCKITTYIQSGNVIFQSNMNISELEILIANKIKEVYDYNIPIFIKSLQEIQSIINDNPFITSTVDIKKLYVVFLKENPESEQDLRKFNIGEDKFQIIKNILYIHYENGAGKSKLTNALIERKLQLIATARNWRTSNKLLEIMLGN